MESVKCLIIHKEIPLEECRVTCLEAYKAKPDRLQKKFKRIVGWKAICKSCPNHRA